MVIKPIRDKKTKKVLTNVEICKRVYSELSYMQNPPSNLSVQEREKLQTQFYKICGGSANATEIMDWLKQINDCTDDVYAQRLIENSLVAVK